MKPNNPKSRRHSLSAVLLAHRYLPLLETVVERVCWCDEVIILLSEPNKEIENLAQRTGAKLHFRKFDGFGTQKQHAFSLASHDWILSVDSDEVVSPLLQDEIEKILGSSDVEQFAAFRLPQQLVFLGKTMRFAGTRCTPVRLFHRKKAHMNSNLVHEQIETPGKVGSLHGPVFHYSYLTLEDYLEKLNRYTTAGAQELFRKGKRTNLFSIFIRLPLLFVRRYFFQLGFLEGTQGFLWSALSAWYTFIKYAKLRELHRSKLPILMYHALSTDQRDALTVAVEDFSKQLSWLSARGYQSISMSQFLEFQEGKVKKEELPPKPILFTFDDGYRSVAELALPLLKKHHFTACLFLTSSYVLEREREEQSKYISFSELKHWTSSGMEVALHTHSHPSLKMKNVTEVLEDLDREEEMLNKYQIIYLRALAYPYGARPKATDKLNELYQGLQSRGIRAAFRIGNKLSPLSAGSNRFEIKRLDIQGNKSFNDFKKKLAQDRLKFTS